MLSELTLTSSRLYCGPLLPVTTDFVPCPLILSGFSCCFRYAWNALSVLPNEDGSAANSLPEKLC